MEWNGSIKSKGQHDWPNRPNDLVCSFMVTGERAMPSYHAAAMSLLVTVPHSTPLQVCNVSRYRFVMHVEVNYKQGFSQYYSAVTTSFYSTGLGYVHSTKGRMSQQIEFKLSQFCSAHVTCTTTQKHSNCGTFLKLIS